MCMANVICEMYKFTHTVQNPYISAAFFIFFLFYPVGLEYILVIYNIHPCQFSFFFIYEIYFYFTFTIFFLPFCTAAHTHRSHNFFFFFSLARGMSFSFECWVEYLQYIRQHISFKSMQRGCVGVGIYWRGLRRGNWSRARRWWCKVHSRALYCVVCFVWVLCCICSVWNEWQTNVQYIGFVLYLMCVYNTWYWCICIYVAL